MPNSTAKFYYRSFIDQDVDGYTLSGDLTPTTRINDRRKNTYAYTDETGTGDGTAEQFTADMSYDRAIDTIFLKSNFKTFIVYYWNEDATGTGEDEWTEITSYSTNTDEFLVISFDEIETKKIKIECTHTISANDEKKIYLCEITKYIDELNLESIKIKQQYEKRKFTNIYGGTIQVTKYPNRGKVSIDLLWNNMTATDYAVYENLKDLFLIDALNVYIYFSDDYSLLGEEALYLVNDISDIEASPASDTLSAGVDAEMELEEC